MSERVKKLIEEVKKIHKKEFISINELDNLLNLMDKFIMEHERVEKSRNEWRVKYLTLKEK